MRIGLVDEIDVEFGRVRENRQVVFGQISVDDATEHLIGDGRFHQGHAETEKHSTDDLAAREPRIQNCPNIINAERAPDSYLSHRIDSDLDENRAVRLKRKLFALFLIRIGLEIGFDRQR